MRSQLPTNPLLAQLGHDSNARLVLFHADDIGLCRGSNQAFVELCAAGIVKSGSIMMPCPWAKDGLEQARILGLDLGVHLTLTCEFTHSRWGPLCDHAPQAGLTVSDGCFWQRVDELTAHADPDAALVEMRTQIDQAYAAGLDVTHIDTHMGAATSPLLLPAYLQLGLEYSLPSLLVRHVADVLKYRDEKNQNASELATNIFELERKGVPLFDWFRITPCYANNAPAQSSAAHYEKILGELPPGITYFSLHPNAPGDIEQLLPDLASWRTFEYEYFQSEQLRHFLDTEGIVPIGMREIRTAMRRNLLTAIS